MNKLKNIDMQELNEMVEAAAVMIGIVGMTVALMYFGLALGY